MASTSLWVSRFRKLGRRVLSGPRAVVAAPVTACTQTRAVRRAEARGVQGPVLVLSIYRAENAPLVAAALAGARERGWTVRLWALDAVAPELAADTVGDGPGAKCLLLNRMFAEAVAPADGWAWVAVLDDDFVVKRGSLAALLALGERGRLDLFQPAHTERSHLTFPITRRRAWSLARRTTFVEGGPAFVVRGPWVDRVLPYPDRFEMGFGIELVWEELGAEGARLGIVDATPVRHVRPVGGGGYVKAEEMARLRDELERRGHRDIRETQRTLARWRPWQDEPRWSRS